jgi:hypothetical protein
MEELRRKVKTGALNVILTNEDDEEIGRFPFNPVDLNIVRRYEEVVANLEKMELPEDATEQDILELSDKLEGQIDYLLNSKASKSVFAICNPLTLTESGDFFIENIIVEIADIIEQVTDQRIKKKQAKIKRATSKYNK